VGDEVSERGEECREERERELEDEESLAEESE
jgi:hypothetical protein